jgi:hypothetical protein
LSAGVFITSRSLKGDFMRIISTSAFGLTCAMTLWSTTALAEATDQGAADLLAVFQTYLGSTEGVVAVAVDGDAYQVTLDAAPLMAQVPAEIGMTSTISPIVMTLTDNGDGTWDYEVDQPVSVVYDIPGEMTTKTEYEQVSLTGTFDEALGDTSAYSLAVNNMLTEQTQIDPTFGEMVMKVTQDSVTIDGTAQPGVAGGVDGQFTTSSGNLRYEMTIPGGEGMATMPFVLTMAEGSGEGTMTGYQSKGLYGLLAYFVARPDPALIEADMPGLKAALEAALPIFANLQMTGVYKTLALETPMGLVGMDEVGLAIDMNGAVAEGKFRQAISLKGLTLPEGMVPPFAAAMVPTDMTLDVAATSFDLAAGAALGLGLLDLPADAAAGPEFSAQLLSAILPKGSLDITIAPGETNAPGYRLTYEANMAVGPAMPMPVGKARIGLTGMDKINEALLASPPEMGLQEMGMMLGMAQMMSQPGVDGELIWEIEATEAGGLLINGQDMMGGGQ